MQIRVSLEVVAMVSNLLNVFGLKRRSPHFVLCLHPHTSVAGCSKLQV